MKALLFFCMCFCALPAARASDIIATLSELLHQRCESGCIECGMKKKSVQTQTGEMMSVVTAATRSDLLKETAHDQIGESECEYHYLSQLDQNGDNDQALTCGRYNARTSTGINKAIAMTMQKAQVYSSDPNQQTLLKHNIGVARKQAVVIKDLASKIRTIATLKLDNDRLQSWDKLKRCARTEGYDDRWCPKYEMAYKENNAAIDSAYHALWNSNNSFVEDYVNRQVDAAVKNAYFDKTTGERKISFDENKFMAQALNEQSLNSFQRQVIEPSKDQLCGDLQYYRQQENSGDLAVDKANPDAEDKKRDRRYKKLLTLAALAKMDTDPAFNKKYGALRCSLDTDYGQKAETVEKVVGATVQISAVMLAVFQPELTGLAVDAFELEGAGAICAEVAVASVVHSANAWVNLKSNCFEDPHPALTARQLSCSRNKKKLETNVNDQVKLFENEVAHRNCALGVAMTLLPAAKAVLEAGAFPYLKAAKGDFLDPGRTMMNGSPSNVKVLGTDYLTRGPTAVENLQNDLRVLRADVDASGKITAASGRNAKLRLVDTIKSLRQSLARQSDQELDDMMDRWVQQHLVPDEEGFSSLPGEDGNITNAKNLHQKSLRSWKEYRDEFHSANPKKLVNIHANLTQTTRMLHYGATNAELSVGDINVVESSLDNFSDQMLLQEYSKRYLAHMGDKIEPALHKTLNDQVTHVESHINEIVNP